MEKWDPQSFVNEGGRALVEDSAKPDGVIVDEQGRVDLEDEIVAPWSLDISAFPAVAGVLER